MIELFSNGSVHLDEVTADSVTVKSNKQPEFFAKGWTQNYESILTFTKQRPHTLLRKQTSYQVEQEQARCETDLVFEYSKPGSIDAVSIPEMVRFSDNIYLQNGDRLVTEETIIVNHALSGSVDQQRYELAHFGLGRPPEQYRKVFYWLLALNVLIAGACLFFFYARSRHQQNRSLS